jgi:serine/threonine-protein kinase
LGNPTQVLVPKPENVDPLLGTSLGHFTIQEKLPGGSMGQVYRAWDIRLRRTIALKVIRTDPASDPAAWGRLLREARMASRLNHPNIRAVYDVGEDAGQPYIAMEYVEGRSLTAAVRPRGLPIDKALQLAIQISEGLAYAHAQRIIHRDIKSNNVLVTPDWHAKILDFGLARRIESRDAGKPSSSGLSFGIGGQLAGTLPYMAPEILHGEVASMQSDLWALGILLYEMLTGKLPFEGLTFFETSFLIMASPPPPLPRSVPANLSRVVKRCLEKDQRKRYKSTYDIVQDLRRLWNLPLTGRQHQGKRV